jgi:hypothetical protein
MTQPAPRPFSSPTRAKTTTGPLCLVRTENEIYCGFVVDREGSAVQMVQSRAMVTDSHNEWLELVDFAMSPNDDGPGSFQSCFVVGKWDHSDWNANLISCIWVLGVKAIVLIAE